MKSLPIKTRTLALLAVIVPLIVLFIYVALRSGPLAPVPVTVVAVEERSIAPGLFGLGTVETRYTYKIGPTYAGRVKTLDVHVGDQVKAGQLLGEMDPVDLDERLRAQEAALKLAEARVQEAEEKQSYAQAQAVRYEKLLAVRSTSEEIATAKKHEQRLAEAGLAAAREDVSRTRAELEALAAQRSNLKLIAPVDGIVAVRDADPGTTVVAGQSVVEVIDQNSLWINVRFDQIHARGLEPDLPAQIVLRSQVDETFSGRVLRVEPMADEVTEEMLAKVIFDHIPQPSPPVGELAEVTIILQTLPAAPVIPNAAVKHIDGKLGVWRVIDGDLRYTAVTLGNADLDGQVQVKEGLNVGDQVVVYSENALHAHSPIRVVEHIQGVKP